MEAQSRIITPDEFIKSRWSEIKQFHERPAGQLVKLSRERFFHDLKHGHERGLYFDPKAAQHAVQFFPFVRHSIGEWFGEPFVLAPWQEFDVIWNLFGWKRADGSRRFREAYLELTKKTGKSTFVSALGLYFLMADGEFGAQIYAAATKRDQARIIHNEAIKMARASKELRPHLSIFKNNISMDSTGSKFEPLSADAESEDGFNPHATLVDELHRWKTRDLLDIIEQSSATRRQPMMISTTTAGNSRYTPCWSKRQHAVSVLNGFHDKSYVDDTFYAYISTIDEKDDPFDETVWAKANPGLGINIKIEEMREKAARAKRSVADLNAFLRFRLNVWTEQAIRWIPISAWDKCKKQFSFDIFRGKKCKLGIDLSSTTDLTAMVLSTEHDNEIYVWPYFFVPEENIEKRSKADKVPYTQWVSDGLITPTPGEAVDYDYLLAKIDELATMVTIEEIALDPWNGRLLKQELEKRHYKVQEITQNKKQMSLPSKIVEVNIMKSRIRHNGNEVLRWNMRNVSCKKDAQENIFPDKEKSAERIDGVVAMIMSVFSLVGDTGPGLSIYESRGVVSV